MRQKQRVFSLFLLSPSSRRAWIEIPAVSLAASPALSPSSRRAWIEITSPIKCLKLSHVALLTEGVDRNIFRVVQPY